MTFMVPFDGAELARTALVRARRFSEILSEDVVAVSVVPSGNTQYARERGWIDDDAAFDLDAVVETLESHVGELAPDAEFEYVTVDPYAPSGTIARALREKGRTEDASIVFIGSENAGHIASALGSVGAAVASEHAYDVHIVRSRASSDIEALPEGDARAGADGDE